MHELLTYVVTFGAAVYVVLDAGITWLASTWVRPIVLFCIVAHIAKSLMKSAVTEVLNAREGTQGTLSEALDLAREVEVAFDAEDYDAMNESLHRLLDLLEGASTSTERKKW